MALRDTGKHVSEPAWLVSLAILALGAFLLGLDGAEWRAAGTVVGLAGAGLTAALIMKGSRSGFGSWWLALTTTVAMAGLLVAMVLVWV